MLHVLENLEWTKNAAWSQAVATSAATRTPTAVSVNVVVPTLSHRMIGLLVLELAAAGRLLLRRT